MSLRISAYKGRFLIGLDIFVVFSILSSTFYYRYFEGTLFYVILLISLLIALRNEFMISRTTKKELFGFCFCFLLALISFIFRTNTSSYILSSSLILIYCGRRYQFEDIAEHILKITVMVLVFVIGSSLFGIIENHIFVQVERNREGLGFLYTLTPSTLLLNITAIYCYLRKRDLSIINVSLLIVSNIWIYAKTLSRTTIALSLLIILYFSIDSIKNRFHNSKKQGKERKELKVLVFSYIVCAVISIYLTITFDTSKPFYVIVNTLFGGRLGFGKRSIVTEGLSLFPRQIYWYGNGLNTQGEVTRIADNIQYNYVDCLYVQIMQHYGIIILICYLTIASMMMYKLFKSKNYNALVICSIVAIHCMTDDMQLYLQFNTFWMLTGALLLVNPHFAKTFDRDMTRVV